MTYEWSVAFGTVYAALIAAASWPLFILGAYSGTMWSTLAAVMFLSALAVFAGVMTIRPWLVASSVALSIVFGGVAFYRALELSEHRDAELVIGGVAASVCGVFAATLSAKASRAA